MNPVMEMNKITTEFDIADLLAQHPDTVKTALITPKRFIKGLEAVGFNETAATAILGKVVHTVQAIVADEDIESEPESK